MQRGLAKFKEPWKIGRKPVAVRDWTELQAGDILKSPNGRHVMKITVFEADQLEYVWIRGGYPLSEQSSIVAGDAHLQRPDKLDWSEAWRNS
jgi:hypothetical protein